MYWEGNVRQLQNAIHKAVIFSESGKITTADFDHALPIPANPTLEKRESLDLDQIIKETCVVALKRHKGNKGAAAADLGVGRQTMYNYITKYGLSFRESVEESPSIPAI
jgi:transcriptional regulator of acetoin/glycerol metabolism